MGNTVDRLNKAGEIMPVPTSSPFPFCEMVFFVSEMW